MFRMYKAHAKIYVQKFRNMREWQFVQMHTDINGVYLISESPMFWSGALKQIDLVRKPAYVDM